MSPKIKLDIFLVIKEAQIVRMLHFNHGLKSIKKNQ